MPLISPTLPNNGETADAPDVNIPFEAILGLINGNLDHDNLDATDSYTFNNVTASGIVTANGIASDTISEKTSAAGVTVDGLLIKDGGIGPLISLSVDTINEKTSANGVTIDGLKIKDNKLVTAASVPASTLEYNLLDGVASSTYRWDISSDVLGGSPFNGVKAFAHGLAYTPRVDAIFNWKASGADALTTRRQLPYIWFGTGSDYWGLPPGIVVEIPFIDSSNIYVRVTVHDALGLSQLLGTPVLTFRFYCYKYPDT